MKYSLRYTPAAVKDFDSLYDDVLKVSKDNNTADRYLGEFIEKIEEKVLFPLSGIPLIYRGLFTGFYSINYKKYKAFYRVNGKYVEVIRVLLGKTDYMSVLFPIDNDQENNK